jgi:hypothetical protein
VLADSSGRIATDQCNLRCSYCMPAEGLDWLPGLERPGTPCLPCSLRGSSDVIATSGEETWDRGSVFRRCGLGAMRWRICRPPMCRASSPRSSDATRRDAAPGRLVSATTPRRIHATPRAALNAAVRAGLMSSRAVLAGSGHRRVGRPPRDGGQPMTLRRPGQDAVLSARTSPWSARSWIDALAAGDQALHVLTTEAKVPHGRILHDLLPESDAGQPHRSPPIGSPSVS